jgi:trigger factor
MSYEPKDGAAEIGDQVTIDFAGKIDGELFEGGSAEDAPLALGGNVFIPGFEEGLVGSKAGEERVVEAAFPEDYPVDRLAGKTAVFDVKIKSVGAPQQPAIDDAFAKGMGFEDLEKLREAVRGRIKNEYDQASRLKLKRKLLDSLDERHDLALPPTLVEQEFESVWRRIKEEMERAGRTFEDEGTTEEEVRQKYQKLAERRVRLGLVLSEIGTTNDIKVSEEEVKRAMLEQIRQYPGQEQQIFEFYKKNPQAVAQLRAPIYEDKVVDFALELANVAEKTVTAEELLSAPEEEGEALGEDNDRRGSEDS